MAPGARLRTKVYGCLGRVPSADGHPKSAVVESSYEVEGVGIHGIGIALANHGVSRTAMSW